MADTSTEMVVMRDITKIYSNNVVASNHVNFSVKKGEIHAIMGENGAGKTTLMKILFGLERPDSGEIYLHGEKVTIGSPLTAIRLGIGMVHQHFMLVPNLTVAENMFLGIEPHKKGFFSDRGEMEKAAAEVCEKYNFPLNPRDKVKNLSVASMQKLEILKALVRGAKILILDEPTAVLTPQETSELFRQLVDFKDNGFTIIFISHKLREIKEICDRITVMKNGKNMGVYSVADVSEQEISRLMVGRDVILHFTKEDSHPGQDVLAVSNLCCYGRDGRQTLKNVSLTLREGEILGVAGVEGNGQRELVESITGMRLFGAGSIKICGEEIRNKSIRKIRALGMSHIPQDRMKMGVAPTASIADNLVADRMQNKEYCGTVFVRKKRVNQYIGKLIRAFQIKCARPAQQVSDLSGGNIQKVVIARELSNGSKLVVADQPTRGVDVGATEFVRSKLVEMRNQGVGVLLVSADLNEVMEMSDRLIVLYNGELVAHFADSSKVSEDELGEYMLGLNRQSEEEIEEACCVASKQ